MTERNSSEISWEGLMPWQSPQWKRMLSHVAQKTLPHAFLFSGDEGVGKLSFAKYLSSFVLCEAVRKITYSDVAQGSITDKINEPCGHCKQCKLFESDTHPDFKFIQPEEGSASIKVDQIRHLVDFFGQSSQQGGQKIAIVSPAEALNNNAANALLKTLEEPSQNSLIILISHQSGMLLPTIRSRCQVVDFSLPPLKESLEWLNRHKNELMKASSFSEDDLMETLLLANKSPLKAISYFEIGALAEYKLMLDELGALLKNDCLSSTLATRWNDDKALLRLSWMMLWLEQILKLKFGTGMLDSGQANKMFSYLSEKASNSELFGLYSNCLKQYKLFNGTSNPNKILSFETLLHEWSSLMRKS